MTTTGPTRVLKGALTLGAMLSAIALTSGCSNIHSLESERIRLGIECQDFGGGNQNCTKQGNECLPLDGPQLWNCYDPTADGYVVQYPPN